MYVVQPCFGKDISDIHDFLLNSALLAKLKKEGAVVEVQNSTGQSSLENKYKKLASEGIEVKFVPFRGKVSYEQTIFYNNSSSEKPNTLDFLKSNYQFQISDVSYPTSAADFVIVIGKDAL